VGGQEGCDDQPAPAAGAAAGCAAAAAAAAAAAEGNATPGAAAAAAAAATEGEERNPTPAAPAPRSLQQQRGHSANACRSRSCTRTSAEAAETARVYWCHAWPDDLALAASSLAAPRKGKGANSRARWLIVLFAGFTALEGTAMPHMLAVGDVIQY